jgi:hypothetical protein
MELIDLGKQISILRKKAEEETSERQNPNVLGSICVFLCGILKSLQLDNYDMNKNCCLNSVDADTDP